MDNKLYKYILNLGLVNKTTTTTTKQYGYNASSTTGAGGLLMGVGGAVDGVAY